MKAKLKCPSTDTAQLIRGTLQPQSSSKSDYLDAALRHCQITVNIGVCGGHTNTCSKLIEEQPTNK